MKNALLIPMLLMGFLSYSQNSVVAYKTRAQQVAQSKINTYLTEFASYGIKTTGSVENNSARAWLKTKYKSFGYLDSDIEEQPFSYERGSSTTVTSTNLIINKVGSTYPNKFIIICGHYDTINGPGVNDNGSGVAAILEAARILKNVPTEYSIKFINFSGEEQGLYGSQAYVDNIVLATPKMDIKLVINIDEIGGTVGQGVVNNKIYAEKDGTPSFPSGMYSTYPSTNNTASATATTELMNCMTNYSNITPVIAYAERSDYMPFEKNNFIITGLYEYNQSVHPHKTSDTKENMDPVYLYNVTQGVVGALQHFAKATTSVPGITDEKQDLRQRVSIFPNPASNFINIGIDGKGFTATVTDLAGKTLINTADEQTINTSKLINGVYMLTVHLEGENVTKKFIITK